MFDFTSRPEGKVLDLAILEIDQVSLLVEHRGDAELVLAEHGAIFGLGHDEAAIDGVLNLHHNGPDTVVQQLDQGSGLMVKPGGDGEYMKERMTIRLTGS